MLNADELGEKGEKRFSEICVDAHLICNKSTRDRTGWDFIVEFPFEPQSDQSTLDKRPVTISCCVQVKTTWNSNDKFRMPLSAAERLAKEPKPAFVYVLQINKELEFVNAYLVHILDDNLATILKRLRKEHAKGCTATHQKTITFHASQTGQNLPPAGEAFRNLVKVLCEPDMQAYIAKKAKQVDTLGFSPERYEIKTQLRPLSRPELVDVFLGLRKADISDLRTFETRFGIKIAVPEPSTAKGAITMDIQPGEADQCRVTVRENAILPPAVFDCSVFFPAIPNLSRDELKIRMESQFFQLIVEYQGLLRLTLKQDVIESGRFEIEDWINLTKMLITLCEGTGSITIMPSKILGELMVPISSKLDADCMYHRYLLEAFEGTQKLFKRYGAAPPKVSLVEINNVIDKLVVANRVFGGAQNIPPLLFKATWPPENKLPENAEAVYIDFITVADVTLAYYAVAELTPEKREDHIIFHFRSIEPRGIRVLRDFSESYQAFIDEAKKQTNLNNVIYYE